MKFLKSKAGIISMIAVFFAAGLMLFTAQTNNGKNSFRKFYDGSVSWYDSLGNIDSLNYPYYLNGKDYEDFSLINGQSTINYRCSYVTASTNDTLLVVVRTKTEGAHQLVVRCDTVRLPGTTTAVVTSGTFSFSANTGPLWQFEILQGTAGDGTANRNNGYLLFDVWSPVLNTVPSKFRLGNYQ